jgi:hypothetical protein
MNTTDRIPIKVETRGDFKFLRINGKLILNDKYNGRLSDTAIISCYINRNKHQKFIVV